MDRPKLQRPKRQTALVALEMNRYNVDIAALGEVRLPGYDNLEDHGYFFFWSGIPSQERREAGLGFPVRKEIAAKLDEEPEGCPIHQTVTIRQRQFANRFTGSRFAVNASRYTGNLINHHKLNGNAYRKSICKTLRKHFASNCQGLLKSLSNRLDSTRFERLVSVKVDPSYKKSICMTQIFRK